MHFSCPIIAILSFKIRKKGADSFRSRRLDWVLVGAKRYANEAKRDQKDTK